MHYLAISYTAHQAETDLGRDSRPKSTRTRKTEHPKGTTFRDRRLEALSLISTNAIICPLWRHYAGVSAVYVVARPLGTHPVT
ncbi:hypothetical protein STSO111631_17910 [Stackebrandtia soli]